MRKLVSFSSLLLLVVCVSAQSTLSLGKLKYGGGGDWYANRTGLPNLIQFCNQQLKTNINPNDDIVEAGGAEIFNYPYLYLTGHGNVVFTEEEQKNLRDYMLAGGFLHIDDNYGMDPFVRPQIKKIFPDINLVELPPSHPIFKQTFTFAAGLPKIHEHDGKRPQAFGIIKDGRLLLLYTYESDLGNGWEDAGTYPDDSPEVRRKALQMGANILQYVLMN